MLLSFRACIYWWHLLRNDGVLPVLYLAYAQHLHLLRRDLGFCCMVGRKWSLDTRILFPSSSGEIQAQAHLWLPRKETKQSCKESQTRTTFRAMWPLLTGLCTVKSQQLTLSHIIMDYECTTVAKRERVRKNNKKRQNARGLGGPWFP